MLCLMMLAPEMIKSDIILCKHKAALASTKSCGLYYKCVMIVIDAPSVIIK